MPESRNRTKHHPHPHPHRPPMTTPHHTLTKARRSAAFVVSLLAAILGLAVAFFTQGAEPFWMIVGTLSGGIIGYFVGHNMDKSLAKSSRK